MNKRARKKLKRKIARVLISAGKVGIFVPFVPGSPLIFLGKAMLPPSQRKKVKILPPVVSNLFKNLLPKSERKEHVHDKGDHIRPCRWTGAVSLRHPPDGRWASKGCRQ